MIEVRTLPIAVLVLAFGAGCAKKSNTDCGQVSAHFVKMVEAQLARDADSERMQKARANLPTLQNALLESCVEDKWDLTSRQCILAARTAAETKQCAPGVQPQAHKLSTEE